MLPSVGLSKGWKCDWKDNPLCQLLPKASLNTRHPQYFTFQSVRHLLAGIHVLAINLDHAEQQKLWYETLMNFQRGENLFLDLLPHIAQLRKI